MIGQCDKPSDFPVFNRAVQSGETVHLTIRTVQSDGDRDFKPGFASPFADGTVRRSICLALCHRLRSKRLFQDVAGRGYLFPGD